MKSSCPTLFFSFTTLGSGRGAGTSRAGCLDVAGSYGPDGAADSEADATDDAGDGVADVSTICDIDGAVLAGAASLF